jgi:hypothetical protein
MLRAAALPNGEMRSDHSHRQRSAERGERARQPEVIVL